MYNMYNIVNTTLEEVRSRLKKGYSQRVVLEIPETRTSYEMILTPLNNKWEELRMTGTDERYVCVGIIKFGCYPFDISREIGVGYLATKLGVMFEDANYITEFLHKLKLNLKKED